MLLQLLHAGRARSESDVLCHVVRLGLDVLTDEFSLHKSITENIHEHRYTGKYTVSRCQVFDTYSYSVAAGTRTQTIAFPLTAGWAHTFVGRCAPNSKGRGRVMGAALPRPDDAATRTSRINGLPTTTCPRDAAACTNHMFRRTRGKASTQGWGCIAGAATPGADDGAAHTSRLPATPGPDGIVANINNMLLQPEEKATTKAWCCTAGAAPPSPDAIVAGINGQPTTTCPRDVAARTIRMLQRTREKATTKGRDCIAGAAPHNPDDTAAHTSLLSQTREKATTLRQGCVANAGPPSPSPDGLVAGINSLQPKLKATTKG